MHICFIDESGTPPPPGKKGVKYFVLGAVIVPEGVWHGLSAELQKIKNKWDLFGEIKWRHFSPTNNQEDNPMIDLEPTERYRVREELLQAMTRYKAVRMIATVADVERCYAERSYIRNESDLYHFSYKQLSERFQYHLQDQSREVGSEIRGIVVIDHRQPQDDQRLRSLHQGLVNSKSDFSSNYGNLVECLFIAPSHLSVGIQFADLVAGSVFRWVERDDSRCFDMIKQSFRKSPGGKIEGYGIVRWPK